MNNGTMKTKSVTRNSKLRAGDLERQTPSAETGAGDLERQTSSAEPGTGDLERQTPSVETGAGDLERQTPSAEPGTGDLELQTSSAEPGARMYYSIKDVSMLLDEPESTLRYWQDEFPEVIDPPRNDRGARFYTKSDIKKVRMIKYFIRDCGLTLDGVRKKLKNKESAEKQANLALTLQSIRARLVALDATMAEVANMN